MIAFTRFPCAVTVIGGNTAALKVDGSAVIQPVSLTALPTGVNTIGAVSVIGGNTVALKVDGSAATQPVSGTFWQTTQPVSLTTLPTGANTIGAVAVIGGNAAALKVDGSAVTQPVSLTALPALPTGANIIGGITNASFAATQASAANLNATVVGTGVFAVQAQQSGAWNIGAITTLPALPAGANSIGTVQQAAIIKGVQGATGVTTQALIDAGRSSRTLILDSFAVAATTETLNPMSISADNGAATAGTSYAVTIGKRFRLQQVTATLHTIAGNTTAVSVLVRLRVNNAGAALVSSAAQLVFAVSGVAAANSASAPVTIPLPDGFEMVSGAGLGITTTCAGFVATTAAPKVDICLLGFEY